MIELKRSVSLIAQNAHPRVNHHLSINHNRNINHACRLELSFSRFLDALLCFTARFVQEKYQGLGLFGKIFQLLLHKLENSSDGATPAAQLRERKYQYSQYDQEGKLKEAAGC